MRKIYTIERYEDTDEIKFFVINNKKKVVSIEEAVSYMLNSGYIDAKIYKGNKRVA